MMTIFRITCITVLIAAMGTGCRPAELQRKSEETTLSTTTNTSTMITQRISACLWVEKDAKAVVDYCLSVFKDGKLKEYHRYPNPPEAIEMGGLQYFETALMEIAGMEFQILAAGPYFTFNESISFVINCADQAEVDYYWNALTAEGEESNCGWLKDKYGLSWQVVPVAYYALINSDDPAVREKAMQGTMKQKKIILNELR